MQAEAPSGTLFEIIDGDPINVTCNGIFGWPASERNTYIRGLRSGNNILDAQVPPCLD